MGSTLNEVVKISDTGFIDSINSLDLRVNNNTKLFIDSSGNVGIGNTSPISYLSIGNVDSSNSNGTITIAKNNGLGGERQFKIGLNSGFDFVIGDYGSDNNNSQTWTEQFKINYLAPSNSFYITNSGTIGIGTDSPSGGLLHINGFSSGSPGVSRRYTSSGQDGSSSNWSGIAVSLRCSDAIWASEMFLTSDSRIKENITSLNNQESLNIIEKINPVKYNYIDNKIKGNQICHGFIAQEIEDLIQDSTLKHVDYIPNIYKECNIKNDILVFKNKHNISSLTKIKLFTYENDIEISHSVNIIKLIDEYSIQIDKNLNTPTCFVYGEEINDFRTLKYESILSIAVSAIKELNNKINNLENKIIN